MTRISTVFVVISALASFALAANGASAGNVAVRTTTPQVHLQTPKVPVKPTLGVVAPRTSGEVIVNFEEGDPDRPITVGKIHNGSVKNFGSAKTLRYRDHK